MQLAKFVKFREEKFGGVLFETLDAEELFAQDAVIVPWRNPGEAAVGAAQLSAGARSGQRGS